MAEWRVPGFTELRELGEGGQGLALLVREEVSGRTAVLKYLVGAEDPAAREAFRRESTILKGVASPYVARWYGHYEDPAGSAILMEAVPGRSLKDVLAEQGPLAPEAALVVLKGSLLGLAAAHERGVVHRDYKPGNVIVRDDGVSKLIDFGVAGLRGEASRSGTPAYMAPEQWSRRAASPATDVYAATCVFFECVTGRRPFGGEFVALQRGHLLDAIPVEAVPEPLRPLVAAGLAKLEADRPPSATAFVEHLETVAAGTYGDDWETRGVAGLAAAAVAVAAVLPAAALTAGGGTATAAGGTTATGTAAGSTGSSGGLASTVGGKVALVVGGLTAAGVVTTAGVLVANTGHHHTPVASPRAAALVAAVSPYSAPPGGWLGGSYVSVTGGNPALRIKINNALREPYDDELAFERFQVKAGAKACPPGTSKITPTITLQRPTLLSVRYLLDRESCVADNAVGTYGVNVDLATGQSLTPKDYFLPSALTTGITALHSAMTLQGARSVGLCTPSEYGTADAFRSALTGAGRQTEVREAGHVVFTASGIEVWVGAQHLCGQVHWTAPYSAIRRFLQPAFAARL